MAQNDTPGTLYITRDSRQLLITNRKEGSISVWGFAAGRLVGNWRIPGGGRPDMGNLSADGRVFWVSGRNHSEVYAIDIVEWTVGAHPGLPRRARSHHLAPARQVLRRPQHRGHVLSRVSTVSPGCGPRQI